MARQEAIPESDDDVFRRFAAARVFGYVVTPFIAGGVVMTKWAMNYQ